MSKNIRVVSTLVGASGLWPPAGRLSCKELVFSLENVGNLLGLALPTGSITMGIESATTYPVSLVPPAVD